MLVAFFRLPISDVVPRQPGVEGLPLFALVYAPASSNGVEPKKKANGKMQMMVKCRLRADKTNQKSIKQ